MTTCSSIPILVRRFSEVVILMVYTTLKSELVTLNLSLRWPWVASAYNSLEALGSQKEIEAGLRSSEHQILATRQVAVIRALSLRLARISNKRRKVVNQVKYLLRGKEDRTCGYTHRQTQSSWVTIPCSSLNYFLLGISSRVSFGQSFDLPCSQSIFHMS